MLRSYRKSNKIIDLSTVPAEQLSQFKESRKDTFQICCNILKLIFWQFADKIVFAKVRFIELYFLFGMIFMRSWIVSTFFGTLLFHMN